MHKFLYIILFFITSLNVNAEMIKPDPSISSKDVISIQLKALQVNNSPFEDAGIEQTWEFAHPNNRAYTGPLTNFIVMMNSPSYSMMIDHLEHKIIFVEENENDSYYFVELLDNKGNKYGFQWTISKVLNDDEYKDCWMTIGVSRPMLLSNST